MKEMYSYVDVKRLGSYKIVNIKEPEDVKFMNINGSVWYYNINNNEEDKILNKLKLIVKYNYSKELMHKLYDILRLGLSVEEENNLINLTVMEN